MTDQAQAAQTDVPTEPKCEFQVLAEHDAPSPEALKAAIVALNERLTEKEADCNQLHNRLAVLEAEFLPLIQPKPEPTKAPE